EDTLHQRPGGVYAVRPEPDLVCQGRRGGYLLRGPALRLPRVHRHLPRRPGLLRAWEPRSRPRWPRVPRWLHAARRAGRGGRRRRGGARRTLGVSSLLGRSQPVHRAPHAPPGAGALGQDSLPGPPRPSEAQDLRDPLPALRPRGRGGYGPRGLRVLRGPDRQARTLPVATWTRTPLRAGSGKGPTEGRDQDRQRLRSPNPRRV
ncbi:MAG: hypothetical protein AVDCRST_MAG58-895, partial [uncultured Rubrobacteraceae bacterium]